MTLNRREAMIEPETVEQLRRLREVTGFPLLKLKSMLESIDYSEREQWVDLLEQSSKSQGRLTDPIEEDPEIRPLFLEICEEASKILDEAHTKRIAELENTSPAVADLFRSGRGLCHAHWNLVKKLMLERHGIHWRSPAEMNPLSHFD